MKVIILWICMGMFLFINTLFAQVDESTPEVKYQSTITAAYDGYWLSYKEYADGRLLDKDTGWISGGFLEYRGDTKSIFFRVNLDISGSGSARYDGAIQDVNTGEETPYSSDTREIFYQAEASAGYKAARSGKLMFAPCLAFGYRDWLRGRNSGSDYMEDYSWNYLGIGLNLLYKNANLSFGIECLYEYMINPKMTTDLSGYADDTTFKIKPKPGFRVEGSIAYKFTDEKYFLFLNPYYQRWKIGASDPEELKQGGVSTGYYFYEPDSTTDIYGFKLGAGIKI